MVTDSSDIILKQKNEINAPNKIIDTHLEDEREKELNNLFLSGLFFENNQNGLTIYQYKPNYDDNLFFSDFDSMTINEIKKVVDKHAEVYEKYPKIKQISEDSISYVKQLKRIACIEDGYNYRKHTNKQDLITVLMDSSDNSKRQLQIIMKTEKAEISPSLIEADLVNNITFNIEENSGRQWYSLSSFQVESKYFQYSYEDCFNLYKVNHDSWLLYLQTNTLGNSYYVSDMLVLIVEKEGNQFNFLMIE